MHAVSKKVSYNPNNILTRGSYGTTVFIGLFEGVKQVALKRFQRICITDSFLNEAQLMLRVNGHPNIIRYYCCEMDEYFMYRYTNIF